MAVLFFFFVLFLISIVSLCLMSPTFILLMAWWHTKAAKNEISKFSIDLVQWTMYFVLQRWPVSQGFLVSRYLGFCAKWKAALAVTCRWSWCWCCWSLSSCCCCCRPLSVFLFKECVCRKLEEKVSTFLSHWVCVHLCDPEYDYLDPQKRCLYPLSMFLLPMFVLNTSVQLQV